MVSQEAVYKAVEDKNWYWLNDYQILNGVHVYGRRYKPYGNVNYPEEIEKIRQMTELRDGKIHDVARGGSVETPVDDSATRALTEVKTNYNREIEYLDVDKALDQFTLPEGYEIDLFASESEFPDLRNPVQATFDNKGRLWVAVIPSYSHYRPGDERPNDKLIILDCFVEFRENWLRRKFAAERRHAQPTASRRTLPTSPSLDSLDRQPVNCPASSRLMCVELVQR